ncbi:MAG: hypothetical protein WAV73_05325 [Candidatus Moraniibacteriota bacterium]
MTRHHLLPTSRGGTTDQYNIATIPRRYHESWHIFFGNLTPEEAIQFLKTIFLGEGLRQRKKKWTMEGLYELQLAIQSQTISVEKKQKKKKK